MIEIATTAGTAEAFVARPKSGTGPWPGVLFYVDAFGLRPAIEEMAQRIADWGHVVLVPNVMYRWGTVAELAPTGDLRTPEGREAAFRSVMPRVAALTPELSNADAPDFVAALHGLDGVSDQPIGVTGYCMGARLATRVAGLLPDEVAAVGGFHGGRLVTEEDSSPHRTLAGSRASFCYLHADNDRSMTRDDIDALGEALRQTGATVTCNEVFPGAPHGYSMADTASYDPAAAERHFELLRDLFARTLRA